MKIIQIIPSLGTGGAERLVLNMSEGLEALGHEVFIITFRRGNHFLQLSEGKQIEVIPSHVSYSITGKGHFDTDDFDCRIREINPDIIHSHLFESELISRHNPMNGVRYITHWHGLYEPTKPRSFAQYFAKDTWWNLNSVHCLKRNYERCNNQFLCISDFIADYVKKVINPRLESLHVILNGCDIETFGNYSLQKQSDKFELVSVGSFHSYKNHIFLLRVILHLVDMGITDIRLRLVGDGAERKSLESFCTEKGIKEYVDFLGYVNEPGLYMSQADLLVHGAANEPFGLVFLEAMSMGLPIVAFNSGGVPEIVENGKTGFLTDVNDIDGFAKSILKLKLDPSLVAQFSKAGRASVQKFNMLDYVKKIETLYFELLKTKPV